MNMPGDLLYVERQAKAFYSARPGCRPSGGWLIFFFTNFYISLVFGIQDTLSQPVAEVLAYLHVQISSISCWVVGSILACAWKKNTDTAIVGYRWTGNTTPCTVNWCKKVRVAWLASSYCMGFQNFVVSNKIHPKKKKYHTILQDSIRRHPGLEL